MIGGEQEMQETPCIMLSLQCSLLVVILMLRIVSVHGIFSKPLKNKVRKQIVTCPWAPGIMKSGPIMMEHIWAISNLEAIHHIGTRTILKFLSSIIISKEKQIRS